MLWLLPSVAFAQKAEASQKEAASKETSVEGAPTPKEASATEAAPVEPEAGTEQGASPEPTPAETPTDAPPKSSEQAAPPQEGATVPLGSDEEAQTNAADQPGSSSTERGGEDYSDVEATALVEEEEPRSNLIFGVGLDLSLPMGSTADFVGELSIQGFSLDLRYFAWDNWAFGAGIAFDSMSEKTSDQVTWENITFSSVQVREQSFMPITLKGVYAWRDQEKLVPYVAVGAGAARAVRRLATGVSSLSEATWHMAFVPELGSYFPLGPTVLFANIRLNVLPPTGAAASQMYGNFTFGVTVQ
jgi:opacity protein-like surface antigen